MCPFDQATQLQDWTVYNHIWSLSSLGCSKTNWNETPAKQCLLFGTEWHRSKDFSMFPIERFGVETNPRKSVRNLGIIFDKNFTFCSHVSATCSSCFSILGTCSAFVATQTWTAQNYLLMPWLLQFTFVWQCGDRSDYTSVCSESTWPCCDSHHLLLAVVNCCIPLVASKI